MRSAADPPNPEAGGSEGGARAGARFTERMVSTINSSDVDALPTELTKLCVEVLAVDGAGLSAVSEEIRVPLGASNEHAVAAERLQFVVGEGPCLQALRDGTEIRVSADDIERRWPMYYDELLRRTPYRSIASVPLQLTPTLAGAIDFYFDDPVGAFGVDLGAAVQVADRVGAALMATSTPAEPSMRTPNLLLPAWMYSPNATSRARTWIAAGVIMADLGITAPDAISRLRAYAYSHQADIPDVTDAIIDGALHL